MAPQPEPIKVVVDCDHELGELRPIWRSFGYDELNWTYTKRGKEVFREIRNLSEKPYYIRCHHTLTTGNGLSVPTKGSGSVCSLSPNGELCYDFKLVDQVIETFLEHNCKPIIELGFMPDALSKAPRRGPTYDYSDPEFWKYPPKDYQLWQELVFKLVRHCLERYGEEEVITWYWEVWNEPDNPGFFKGSIRDYCRLYDHTVAGATEAFDSIRIGGPALARDAKFLQRFLKHCTNGKNSTTGDRGARLDFISLHAKGNGWPSKEQPFEWPSLKKIEGHLQSYLQVLSRYPHYKDVEILLDECDMAVATNYGVYDFPELLFNNTEYYPVFVIRMAKRIWDLVEAHKINVRLFTTWAFYFEGKRLFEGNRALFTNENIKKPVFNAFVALEKLGRKRLKLAVEASPTQSTSGIPQIDGLGTRASDEIVVLVWNFVDSDHPHEDTKLEILLENVPFHVSTAAVEMFRIDAEHSNSFATWQKLGCPQILSEEEIHEIKSSSQLEPVLRQTDLPIVEGRLDYSVTLTCPAAVLLRFTGALL